MFLFGVELKFVDVFKYLGHWTVPALRCACGVSSAGFGHLVAQRAAVLGEDFQSLRKDDSLFHLLSVVWPRARDDPGRRALSALPRRSVLLAAIGDAQQSTLAGATGDPPTSLHPMKFPVQPFPPVRWVMQHAVAQAWPLDRRSPALFHSPQVYAGAGGYHDTMPIPCRPVVHRDA
jgi:hypothetical protein